MPTNPQPQDRLIAIPDFAERAAWTSWDDLNFLHCDLCGQSELDSIKHPNVGDWEMMYWDYDGIVVCTTCKETGEHLKLDAA